MTVCPGMGLLGASVVALSSWIFGHAALDRLFAERSGVSRDGDRDLDTGRDLDAGRDPGGVRDLDRHPALAATLGLGLIAQAIFVLGMLGLLHKSTLLLILLGAHLACFKTWRGLLPRVVLACRSIRLTWLAPATLLLAPIVLLGLYPPTGWDETAYHLPYVRAFLEAGGLVFAEHLRYPVFPQTAESIFLLASLIGGDLAAGLTQTFALILAAALLAEWGARAFSPRVGRWAAAMWIGTPLVVWLGTMAYVDILLTLFTIAAFSCWQRWRDHTEGPDGAWRYLALAGFFAGMAAATKYLGLVVCGLLGVLTLGRSLRLRRLGPAVLITVIATAMLAPWYARIIWHTGNPVFPFYAPLFGENEWTTKHDRLVFEEQGDGGSAANTDHFSDGLATLASLPWTAVFERQHFSNMAPISPWYLLLVPLGFVPLLFVRGPRATSARRLAACFLAYAFFWLGLEHDLRFLLPSLPLLNLALLAALDSMARRVRQPQAAWLIALLLVLPGWLWAGYKIVNKGPLPLNATMRADFLERQVPGYGGVRWLNERHGDDYRVLALFAGRLRHHAHGRLYGDAWGPDGHDTIRDALRQNRLGQELDRRDADYFLVDRSFLGLRLQRRLDRQMELIWEQDGFALYRRQ